MQHLHVVAENGILKRDENILFYSSSNVFFLVSRRESAILSSPADFVVPFGEISMKKIFLTWK